MKDYYEILEVSKNASYDTIKKVFRILIKKNHPDLFEGDDKIKAEEKVKDLNEAYEVLISKEKRAAYNLELEEYANKNQDTITVLMEENEYLKNVIKEKNRLIKDFLQDMGVNANELEKNIGDLEDIDNNPNENVNTVDMSEGYNKYKREEQIKRIIYMAGIIIVGVIILWNVTGINIFKIFIDIFKTMF